MNPSKISLISGLFFCFISVGLGAFGAHALRDKLTPAMNSVWQTAVMYQFFHALALIGLSLWMTQKQTSSLLIPLIFIGGVLLFSGSLYVLAFTGINNPSTTTRAMRTMHIVLGWLIGFSFSVRISNRLVIIPRLVGRGIV